MFDFLSPDLKLNSIFELTGELASEIGIRVLIADLDNTMGKYEHEVPDEKTAAWVSDLKSRGIKLAIVSNNGRERVEKFCLPLGVDFYWKSGKPGKKTILRAMEKLGGEKAATALIGDKTITDILGAKRSGIFSIKVPPLGKRRMFE